MKQNARYAVLGAFGKMGSGISMILQAAVATQEYSLNGSITNNSIILIDPNEKIASDVLSKFRTYLRSHAERSISLLRFGAAKDKSLVENHEIIEDFLNKAMEMLKVHHDTSGVKNCDYIFEAATENEPLKVELLKQLKSNNPQAYYFTNTSSIPIQHLANETGLQNKMVGYHFYNPPAKQKLLELVVPESTEKELVDSSMELIKILKKTAVPSNDVAGFIGNGHFMREVLYACETISDGKQYKPEDVVQLDNLSRELLVRPMGIFQLIDYVGIDVCSAIMKVMTQHLKNETLDPKLCNHLLSLDVKGGQNPDGSQKNGFFRYEKNKITGVYSLSEKNYIPLNTKDIQKPASWVSWKETLSMDAPTKDGVFKKYFSDLKNSDDEDAKAAMLYLAKSREFAEHLVNSGVAANIDNVNSVLQLGFHHTYGPGNTYY